MKVLHVAKADRMGGCERHLLALLPALARAGLQVRLCVARTGRYRGFFDPLRDIGIEVSVLRAGPDLNPVLYGGLVKQARDYEPDIVHTHLIHADVHGQLAARRLGLLSVSSVHGTHGFYRRMPYRAAAGLAEHLATRTIAISRYVARFVTELRIARTDRIRVVPYGLDASRWHSSGTTRENTRRTLGLADDAVAIGIASRLVADKGHAFLLDALHDVAQETPSLRLLIAGDGGLRPELEERAKSLPEGSVRFLGFLEDVRPFMAACDVFVFPTMPGFGEGFGLAALEAMAAGLPVIATNVGPVPEVVADGETGLLVAPGAVDELAGAIRRLAGDTTLRRTFGARARQRAETKFSLTAMVDRTMQVYDEIMAVGHSRRSA